MATSLAKLLIYQPEIIPTTLHQQFINIKANISQNLTANRQQCSLARPVDQYSKDGSRTAHAAFEVHRKASEALESWESFQEKL